MNYLLILFLLAFIRITFAQTCGKNEEYKSCGTACPETCKNLIEPGRICHKLCVKGCQCKSGYVRDDNKNCVLKINCPRKRCADPYEEYKACGPACPVTCQNKGKPITCTLPCVPGCFCKRPFIRDKTNGKCVLLDKCFPK